MNATALILAGVATVGGLIGLAVLVAVKIAIDCAERAGLR